MGVPRLNPAKHCGNHFSAEVTGNWIHLVQAIKEVLFECVKGAVSSVARWLYHFLMKGLDDVLVVNLNDSAAPWRFGLKGQHGEQAAGLALVVGRYEISDVSRHRIVCVNEQACRPPEKLLVSQQVPAVPSNSARERFGRSSLSFASLRGKPQLLQRGNGVDQHRLTTA